MVRHRSVRERLPQTVCRAGRLEARVDAAFCPRLQHHPGFGLAGLACGDILGLPIRWMHLNRERVAHVEKLKQQREPVETPGQVSQQLLRPLMKQLPDAPSLERSIGDAAWVVIAIAQQPRFADGAIAGQRRGKQVGQPSATPKPILIDRFESQWIQRYVIQGLSFCCHAHVLSIAAVYSPRRAARLHVAR